MSIRNSPGCPCCNEIIIAVGMYCTRWDVTKNDYIAYFPPQKVTITRLGDGFYPSFVSSPQVIATKEITAEETRNFFSGSNSFDLTAADLTNNDNYDSDGNWTGDPKKKPVMYFRTSYTDGWYRLDYDLGIYGKFYSDFRSARKSIDYRFINFSFPIHDPTKPDNAVLGSQPVNFTCCGKCIVNDTKDIKLSLTFEPKRTSYTVDLHAHLCADLIDGKISRVYPQGDCHAECLLGGNAVFFITGTKTVDLLNIQPTNNITLKASNNFTSDLIHLYDIKTVVTLTYQLNDSVECPAGSTSTSTTTQEVWGTYQFVCSNSNPGTQPIFSGGYYPDQDKQGIVGLIVGSVSIKNTVITFDNPAGCPAYYFFFSCCNNGVEIGAGTSACSLPIGYGSVAAPILQESCIPIKGNLQPTICPFVFDNNTLLDPSVYPTVNGSVDQT